MPIDPSNFDIDDARLDRASGNGGPAQDAPELLDERVSTVRRRFEDKLRGLTPEAMDLTTREIQQEMDRISADLQEMQREGRPAQPAQSDAFRMRLSDLELRVAGLGVPR